MQNFIKNEKGLTLVEVLAALVILSIVLMSFTTVFANTNRMAVSNSEKLVVINLADAYLERVKMTPSDYIDVYPPTRLLESKQKPPFFLTMNNKTYEVLVKIKKDTSLPLLNVVVTVKAVESNISSSVEGFVPYEKSN